MRFVTANDISLRDLVAMARGDIQDTISDMDFLHTLAGHRCFIVPPWILRASPTGQLSRVTRLVYNADGQIDKARVLVATARKLRTPKPWQFGNRFSA